MHWYNDDPWKAYLGWLSPRWADPRQDFDAERWADQLAQGGFKVAVVHAKHHDGLCFFRSRYRSAQPPRDYFGEIVAAARARGIRVVTYYSTTFDSWTAEEHPEWSCRDLDGSVMTITRFPFPLGVCCHINPGYREFLLGQLREIQEAYDTDGFWMDGFDYTGYPTPACFCHYCRKRFETDFPSESLESAFCSDRAKLWQRDGFLALMRDIADISKEGKNDRVVVYNNAGTNLELGYETIDEICTLNSMEAHSPILKSFTSRLLAAQDKPYEIYTPVADTVFSWTPRSTPLLKLEAGVVAAHGGATLAGLDITPSGRIPAHQMEQMAEVGQFTRRLYDTFAGSKPLYDVGLFLPKEQWKDAKGSWAVTLLRHHHAFAQISLHVRDFSRFRVVVIADGSPVTSELAAALAAYVDGGGNLVAECRAGGLKDGSEDLFLLGEVLGVHPVGRHGFDVSYVSQISDPISGGLWNEPIRAGADGFRLSVDAAEVLAEYVYPVARYSRERWIWREPNPPRNEASRDAVVTVNRFGRGRAAFIACPVGTDDSPKRRGMMRLCSNLVNHLLGDPLWETDGPSGVEIVLGRGHDRHFLHLLNHYVDESSRFDRGDETVPVIGGFEVRVNEKRIGRVAKVLDADTGAEVPTKRINDYVCIKANNVRIHRAFVLLPPNERTRP